MTIGEIIRKKQPDVWIRLIREFGLLDEYVSESEELTYRDIVELMKPSTYSGRVVRKHGAITQPHRLVFR